MWDVEAKVILVVMGALGSVPMNLKKKIEVIDVEIPVKLIQKCAMLGPAKKFLRKVLEILRRGNQTNSIPWLP